MEMDSKVQTSENIIHKEKKKISKFIIDETMIKIGSEYIWLWIAIESENKEILAQSISKERNTCLLLKGLLII